MKKLGLATAVFSALTAAAPAFAADLGRPAPPPVYKAPPVVAPYSWTGCYIGVEGGGAWGTSRHTDVNSGGFLHTDDFNVNGGLVGGTVGCNYQMGRWVFGIEDDGSWINAKGSADVIGTVTGVGSTKQNWLDTLRGRLGYAWDRTLIYATGGFAAAGVDATQCQVGVCVSETKTVTGWTVGGGLEYAFWNNWSFKAEYLYADFGSPRFFDPEVDVGGLGFPPRNVRLHENIARVGLNYKF
jgi:outer membrane immunogenic protein